VSKAATENVLVQTVANTIRAEDVVINNCKKVLVTNERCNPFLQLAPRRDGSLSFSARTWPCGLAWRTSWSYFSAIFADKRCLARQREAAQNRNRTRSTRKRKFWNTRTRLERLDY